MAERTGELAGWGAKEVWYQSTRCGFKKGLVRIRKENKYTSFEEVAGSQVTQYNKIFFLFLISPRFPSLKECIEKLNVVLKRICPRNQIAQIKEDVHICASSQAGDSCDGDAGSGLAILDHQLR